MAQSYYIRDSGDYVNNLLNNYVGGQTYKDFWDTHFDVINNAASNGTVTIAETSWYSRWHKWRWLYLPHYYFSYKNLPDKPETLYDYFIGPPSGKGVEERIWGIAYNNISDSSEIKVNGGNFTTDAYPNTIYSEICDKYIKPLIGQWVSKNVTDKDSILIYTTWLNSVESSEQIFAKVQEIGKKFAAQKLNHQNFLTGIIKIDKSKDTVRIINVPIKDILNDLLNGTNDLSQSTQVTFSSSNNRRLTPQQKTDSLDIPVLFGFDDVAKDAGLSDVDNISATAANLETSLKSNPHALANLVKGAKAAEYKEPTDEQLVDLRQCAIITELLHNHQYDTGHGFANYFQTAQKTYGYGSPLNKTSPGNERIYPVSTAYDPLTLTNNINIGPSSKNIFNCNSVEDKGPSRLFKTLWWVFEGKDGNLYEQQIPLDMQTRGDAIIQKFSKLQKILQIHASNQVDSEKQAAIARIYGNFIDQSTADQELSKLRTALADDASSANANSYYHLKNIDIKFDGTNPSTARKDVEVSMSFYLSSIAAMEMVITTIKKEYTNTSDDLNIKISDLITLPNTNKLAKGPGAYLKNQYNPEYSRVRLKVHTEIVTNNDLIVDLSTVDHSVERDSVSGNTTLTINYRGFFESMMNMPFNDVLVDQTTKAQRQKISSDIMKEIQTSNCTPQLVQKALSIEQEIYRASAKTKTAGTMLLRLAKKNLIHGYTLNEQLMKSLSIDGTLLSSKNYVTSVVPHSTGIAKETKAIQQVVGQETKDKDSQNKEVIAASLKNKFFFLGDLMWVVSDCIYQPDSADMDPLVKNMNMRFMVGSISVPDPKDITKKIKINPLCLPIDLAFFTEWFNATVVNKGLSVYPIGVFIRDLIDRLVNNIIYDVCFSTLPPGEVPPVIRGQIFSDFSRDDWKSKGNDGWFLPASGLIFKKNAWKSDFTLGKATKINPRNYYTIYQQFPNFSFTNKSNAKNLKQTNFVPEIFYGIKNNDYNYISSVSFAKTTSPFLREARYFNSNYGNLSLLSNVYDLNFSMNKRKANTVLYPGVIISFVLFDWDYDSGGISPYFYNYDYTIYGYNNPHDKESMAHILGFGGYYIVKSVNYKLEQLSEEWIIDVSTKWIGTDAEVDLNRANEDGTPKLEDSSDCADRFNELAQEARKLNITVTESAVEAPPDPTQPTNQNPPPANGSGVLAPPAVPLPLQTPVMMQGKPLNVQQYGSSFANPNNNSGNVVKLSQGTQQSTSTTNNGFTPPNGYSISNKTKGEVLGSTISFDNKGRKDGDIDSNIVRNAINSMDLTNVPNGTYLIETSSSQGVYEVNVQNGTLNSVTNYDIK